MTKDYNWRTDFNWQDKNDEPVKEAKFPHLTKVDCSFRDKSFKQLQLTPTNNRKDLN
jgi:hypothetical protein